MHQVMSTGIGKLIHNHAKHDDSFKCKVGENDLIAFEVHYIFFFNANTRLTKVCLPSMIMILLRTHMIPAWSDSL